MADEIHLIPLAELFQLEAQCPKCSFSGVFNLEAGQRQQEVPTNCPSCSTDWSTVREAVLAMRKAFEIAQRSLGVVRFRAH